jgi:hypothetical protein
MRVVDAAPITLAFLVLLPCCGCGQNSSAHVAPTVPVKGKITYNGQPLTQGSIKFEPEDSGREAHGSIQPDGTFVLTTFKEGDGAIPGVHRVAVSGTGKVGRQSVPLKFQNPSSSNVEAEVSESKTEYMIELK